MEDICVKTSILIVAAVIPGISFGFHNEEGKRLHNYYNNLVKDYDKRIGPSVLTGKPTVVQCALWIKSLNNLDVRKNEYRVDFYFDQRWNDFRLATDEYNTSVLTDSNFDIWTPDTYFKNGNAAKVQDNPHDSFETLSNFYFEFHPNGDVVKSKRLVMKFHCFLDLRLYPMDTQRCRMEFESFGSSADYLRYEWEEVRILHSTHMMEMEILSYTQKVCNNTYTTGTFSCLYAEIVFRRRLQSYGIQIYFPMIVIVLLSWLGFWVDVYSPTPRIAMGMLTGLAQAATSMNFLSQVPTTIYIKSLDVWCLGCVLFVFATLMEYALAYQFALNADVLQKCNKKIIASKARENTLRIEDQCLPNFTGAIFSTFAVRRGCTMNSINDYGSGTSTSLRLPVPEEPEIDYLARSAASRQLSERMDKASQVMFPVGFLIFNIIYWSIYLKPWHHT